MTGALVLAGRANDGAFAAVSDAKVEALIDIAGRPMISYVVSALQQCPGIERIVIAGDEQLIGPALSSAAAANGDKTVEFCRPGGSLVDNLRVGFDALSGTQRILVITDDAPLVTGSVLADFLERCDALAGEAAVCYAVVPKHSYEQQFPNSRRTYVRLRDGVFTGGNVFLLQTAAAPSLLGLVEQFYARRKQPLALARLLGFNFIWRYLVGRLTIAELERHVSAMAGVSGKAIVTPHGELGFDVDRPEDVPVAAQILAQAKRG